jgi:hypothetical protein
MRKCGSEWWRRDAEMQQFQSRKQTPYELEIEINLIGISIIIIRLWCGIG